MLEGGIAKRRACARDEQIAGRPEPPHQRPAPLGDTANDPRTRG
jgi:hypothetical protein